MTTHTIELPHGHEMRTSVSFTPFGNSAHSIIFDDDASVVGETYSTLYMDYCLAEILAAELSEAAPVFADEAHEIIACADYYCECA